MEHVQPIERPFSWRAAALAVALVLLIALAAVGGFVLIQRLGGTAPAAARHANKPPPAIPLRSRSRISVLVLNGNGVAHAAGNEASRLLARGYRSASATDAPSHAYASSFVLFRPGWQREAQRLAHDAGIPNVAPLDGGLAPAYGGDQLVLILGTK